MSGFTKEWLNAYKQKQENQAANVKQSKYKNTKVVIDGEKFDSKKEAARFSQLVLLEKNLKIHDLKRQVPFDFIVNGQKICRYVADAVYYENGQKVVEDTKSKATRALPVFRIKKKLMKAIYGIDIKIID